ncbi:PD-(D/E)XK nuclease family protein [uncultured Allomuricauda sp.]|uniref:PD-(D/E)XK nuclease family protein n=1 Tax=Flagellimonas sp. W118 TaxID=3410791 RepID=UPI00261462E6|nr:PD-(D/E)XK nuclease family protein [uncultured Allomuricauda sp.]
MHQQSFLEYVLDDLKKKEMQIEHCTFILPSKRSGTFLKKYISERISKNIFAPKILSIEDFIADIAGLSTTTSIDLLLILFKSYKQTKLKTHDDFNSFLKWGQTLIQDFNEIDRYLIPAHDILNYLSAIKDISHWSLKQEKTELVQNYLALWNQLESLYNTFTTSLLQQNKGYQGLVYKTAVKHLDSYTVNREDGPLVFIGFNALNTAESRIIQHLLEQPNTEIYWDIDSHFLDDKIHDAGLFIRDYQNEWPFYKQNKLQGVHNDFLSSKNITITGVPKSASQAKYVGNLVDVQTSEIHEGIKKTALVLADEALLNPILKAIPSHIEEANITMGLPLNNTVLYSFFASFLELSIAHSDKGWFYNDVLQFVSNPYCKSLAQSKEFSFLQNLDTDIKKNNWIYLNPAIILKHYPSADKIDLAFPEKTISPSQWIDNCLALIQLLKSHFQTMDNAMELEYLYRFYSLFNQLHSQLSEVDFIKDLKTLRSFFKQLTASETLDFIGEPLSGLQIMGMLESRNLDFETVIITSVNEGILPSGKSNNSFIPFDVKREYGLPTYKEKDAIYTYHFYRLIQRAKNIHIIYNTEPDVLEGGEKSRLISQLLTDDAISKYVSHQIASPEVKIKPSKQIEITKTPLLQSDIKNLAQNGFSPTSLTNYIRNPIDFYKRNILRINDIQEVEENIAANTFGTIIHDSLEQLYNPYLGQFLTVERLSETIQSVPKVVRQHFKKLLPGANLEKGKFLLVFNVLVKYLEKFIELEKGMLSRHQIRILELEKKHSIELHIKGLPYPIKLKGTIDRVDEVDGVTRIVDYKTGRVDPKNVKIPHWDELIADYDKSKAFQLLCYALLFTKEKNVQNLNAGIYSFKNLGQGFLPFTSEGTLITPETLDNFKTYLEKLILEICNPNIPFTEKEL